MPRPSLPPSSDHPNNMRRYLTITEFRILQFHQSFSYFSLLRSKYLPQRHILEHRQHIFLPWCERSSCTSFSGGGESYFCEFELHLLALLTCQHSQSSFYFIRCFIICAQLTSNVREDNLRTSLLGFNPLTPNDHYSGRTAPLTSKRFILYIYSTNIDPEYFKHGIYSPFFFSLHNALCFIILMYLVPVLFIFYIQYVLKLKKKLIPAPKG